MSQENQPTRSNTYFQTAPAWQSIQFNGSAKEYFGIWISNLLLTLCTLGFYGAWAKVRRQKYFYNRTQMDGYAFAYHATGAQIFKGRMIALLVIISYSVLVQFYPVAEVIMSPLFLLLIPWIINAAMRFSRRMVSYRNVRFNWHGTYLKNLLYIVIGPLIGVLTLGLALPLVSRFFGRYYAESHAYGTTRFSADPNIRQYYQAFLVAVVIPVIVFLGIVAALFVATGQHHTVAEMFANDQSQQQNQLESEELYQDWEDAETQAQTPNDQEMDPAQAKFMLFFVPIFVSAYLFFYFSAMSYGTLCRNLLVRSLTLGTKVRFHSSLSVFRFVWIMFSNLFISLFTLGLMIPWCQIRIYRYICDCTSLEVAGSMEKFTDSERENSRAIGEGFADFEGLDFGI